MNGQVIDGTPIAVDFWRPQQCPSAKLFFLSHMHADHIKGLSSSWQFPIYTSPLTGKLLFSELKVSKHLIKELAVGEAHILPLDDNGKETMTVIVLDANHCPGSVMFAFQGYFGTFVYTGDFRYHPAMMKDPYLMNCFPVDRLYLDNTYLLSKSNHPPRETAANTVVELIRDNPKSKIVIGLRKLGKEDLLVKIARDLKTRIAVAQDVYERLELIGIDNVFTTDQKASRITVQPFHFCTKPVFLEEESSGLVMVILPTSLFSSGLNQQYIKKGILYIVPYSDHSSYPELLEFVQKVKPRKVIPIVSSGANKMRDPATGTNSGQCFDFDVSVFDPFLDPTPQKIFDIPPSVEQFMKNGMPGGNACGVSTCTVQRKRIKRKPLRRPVSVIGYVKGVHFIDEPLEESYSKNRRNDELDINSPVITTDVITID